MVTRGISAIAGAILVSVAFEPTTIIVKLAYGMFGAAAGSIVGKTIEAEEVNVKKQMEKMKYYRKYAALKMLTCMRNRHLGRRKLNLEVLNNTGYRPSPV
jgi:hypothetical protein